MSVKKLTQQWWTGLEGKKGSSTMLEANSIAPKRKGAKRPTAVVVGTKGERGTRDVIKEASTQSEGTS